ncbi:MAG: dockerin type I repeat-containing protein [candidate division Zixibacteria bacterium]|nr:dockerin type I repeat-containing protein [candidate division Zixibacteria bacterium]
MKTRLYELSLTLLAFMLAIPVHTLASESTNIAGEEINWQVISSGGENSGISENYGLSNTVGQTAVGWGSSENYGVNHGFWQKFYITGDADGSGAIDIDDVVYLIAYIFQGGPAPNPLDAGDADCSGAIDIDDVVYVIAYIFSGGPAPGDPNGDEVPDC